jgi:hypothetical protein
MVGKLIDKIKNADIDLAIEKAFVDNESAIAVENRKQLHEGFNRDQQRLAKYKNQAYADKKFRQNPIPGHGNPDLESTQEFHKGIEVRIDGLVIRTLFNDPKSVFLLDKYPNISGLGGKYKQEIIDLLRPQVVNNIRKAIGI